MTKTKRIISAFLIVFLIYSLINIKSFALPNEDDVFDDVIDYSGETTYFGKISKKSEDVKEDYRLTYHSNWAKWQNDLYEKYDYKKFILYNCEYMLDIPFDIQWTERLEPGDVLNREREEEVSYTSSFSKIDKQSIKYFSTFSIGKELGIELPIDILKIKAITNGNFKFGWDYAAEQLNQINEEKTIRYSEKISYTYKNEYSEPIFIQKNYRQRYYVAILCEYEYIYNKSRFGSGLWGRDDNYTYQFTNYKCTGCQTCFIPYGNPYSQYSIYYDRGEMVNITKVENVIFA